MTKKLSNPTPRADVSANTVNNQSLIVRAQVVGTMAPLTALYTSDGAFKAEVDAFVAAGLALEAADEKVTNIAATLTQARGDRDTARTTCKNCHAVVVRQVEKNSATGAVLQSFGFNQLEIVKESGPVMPEGITWSFDHETGSLHLHVEYTGRPRETVVEISPDPVGPSTWRRIEGHGVKRTVPGYGPGTYWVHAANSLADGRGEWFGPVAVVIK